MIYGKSPQDGFRAFLVTTRNFTSVITAIVQTPYRFRRICRRVSVTEPCLSLN